MLDAAVSLVLSLVVAIVTSVATVRLSLSRFYSEKWWERKAHAYEGVIAALTTQYRLAQQLLEEMEAFYFTNEVASTSDEEQAASISESSLSLRELEQATALGSFLLSEESVKVLKTMNAELAITNRNSIGGLEEQESVTRIFQVALSEFIALAKKDLKVSKL